MKMMKIIASLAAMLMLCLVLVACGECEHSYDNACDTSCNECGESRTVSHDYEAADCEPPKTCKICGATDGEPNGHTSMADDGDCTTPVICKYCDYVFVEATNIYVAIYDGYGYHQVYCPCGKDDLGTEKCFDSTPVCGEYDVCDRCGAKVDDHYVRSHDFDVSTGECRTCKEFVAKAKAGDKYYMIQADAFSEANDTVVQLLADSEEYWPMFISSEQTLVIDLNGFDYRIVDAIAGDVSGNLTLINTSDEVSVVSSTGRVIQLNDGASLKVVGNIRFETSGNSSHLEPSNLENCSIDLTEMADPAGVIIMNWGCPDLVIGESILIPEGYTVNINGSPVDLIASGEKGVVTKVSP